MQSGFQKVRSTFQKPKLALEYLGTKNYKFHFKTLVLGVLAQQSLTISQPGSNQTL